MGLPVSEISGGGNAFSFDEIGDKVTGQVLVIERRQQTSFENNTPLTWDDGTPRLLTYAEIQTDLRDDEDDDGKRSLYLKGGNYDVAEGQGLSAERALAQAAKDADMSNIDEGSTLTVVFSGRAKTTVRGYQPAKLYVMKLEAPKQSVSADDLFAS